MFIIHSWKHPETYHAPVMNVLFKTPYKMYLFVFDSCVYGLRLISPQLSSRRVNSNFSVLLELLWHLDTTPPTVCRPVILPAVGVDVCISTLSISKDSSGPGWDLSATTSSATPCQSQESPRVHPFHCPERAETWLTGSHKDQGWSCHLLSTRWLRCNWPNYS